ncbi:MAG: hypothetical protein OXC42_06790 [Gammaproteobacteria bacterium]|nr:hypothetical protein [Gammaproteobacteria bacterium]
MYSADLHTLGIVAYEMLTGKLPYRPSLARDARWYVNLAYLPLAKGGRGDLSMWIDLTLAKTTAQNPSDRYETLSEFIADLTTPNAELVRRTESAPLLENHPTLFWMLASALLSGLLILSLVLR